MWEELQGAESKWRPYLDLLPTSFDTPIFWDDDELSYLQACAVRDKIGKEDADQLFEEHLVPIIDQFPALFGPLAGDVERVLRNAHRMASVVMAYAFDIEFEGPEQEPDHEGYVLLDDDEALPKGLVPLADMLNADADHANVSGTAADSAFFRC